MDRIENKITFLLPTCEPDEMFKNLLPSLKNLVDVKNIIQFAICFQPPYTANDIEKVILELNKYSFTYKYIYKDYKIIKPYVPLIQMRNDCSLLYPNSLVYGSLDDDMIFTELNRTTEFIKKTLNLFLDNNDLSVVCWNKHKLDLLIANNKVKSTFSTQLGEYYRGGISYGFEGLCPTDLKYFNCNNLLAIYQNENLLNLFGGNQDKLLAFVRLNNSKAKFTVLSPAPVLHNSVRTEPGRIFHGWEPANNLEGSAHQFIKKYLWDDDQLLKMEKLIISKYYKWDEDNETKC